MERAVYGITVYRTFTYPPGYMRREPVYNYPELKMFHCGGAVRIPTAHSIRMRGYYINEEKILHPPALKYEEPAKYIDDGRSKKAAPEKKGFFTIRPLR